MTATTTRHRIAIAATLVCALGVYGVGQAVVGDLAARTMAIFVLAAGLWATEALPLFATALIVISLEVLLLATDGGLAVEIGHALARAGLSDGSVVERTPIPAAAFITPFASDIIMLFLGGFLMAAAVARHEVDVLVASRVLRPLTRTPEAFLFGLMGLSAFLSMWMSNTATAAMMVALAGPILGRLPSGTPFRGGALLAIAFGANIGGIGTPIGTPPNAIAFGALNNAGYEVTFLRWMVIAVPLEVLLLAGAGVLLRVWFRPEPGLLRLDVPVAPPTLSRQGRCTLVVLGAAILLWMTGGQHGLSPGIVSLLAATTLAGTGVITSRDIDMVDWKILILMWGALALGVGVEQSGLSEALAAVDLSALPGGLWSAGAVIAVTGLGLSTFMSNTAAAALLVPMALALSVPGREEFAVLVALACSFAMAMPVSTPPNALVYGTGHVPRAAMTWIGGLLSALGLLLLLVGYRFVLPLAF